MSQIQYRYQEASERILACGGTHVHTSESGSRYFEFTETGGHVRVADHPPNVATARWIARESVSSVRVDQPAWRSQLMSIVGPYEHPIPEVLRDLQAYHSDDTHESQSRLKELDSSPCYYMERFITKRIQDRDTPDKKLGRCVHVKVLQPHLFNTLCPIMPEFEFDAENLTADGKVPKDTGRKSTKYYQNRKNEFEFANAGKDVIDDEQLELINGMANAIWRHDTAHEILASEEPNEIIHRWVNKIPRRGMFDAPRPSMGLIADVKTMTGPPTPANFAYSMAKWRYWLQRSWYLQGMQDLYGDAPDGKPWRFLFICVNKKPPHEVAVHELSNIPPEDKPWLSDIDKLSDAEWSDYRTEKLVDELIWRRETNNWRAEWESGIVRIPLPKSARSRFYNVEDDE
jgi:hypothetical protein